MSQVKEVKEASEIVEVIGSRISLQRAGSYMKGLCPFHSEKSPSFFVDESMQRFKCFGCGESGDVISFLEKYEGMSFGEALEHLADKAGIKLKKFAKNSDDFLREEILEVLSLTKQYYHYLLTTHKVGGVGRTYLKKRGINSDSVKLFQLGVAPQSWDGLLTYLHKKKKYSLKILMEAGLIIKGRTGRYYDRFRNRIIFPLTDHRGRVVGFSGRVISGDEKDAKYINSPETVLYHKSKMLFGFSELYQQIREAKQVVVVEGEFDVISSVQAHMNSIVAIKGSALTTDHAKLLKRTVNKVLLSLDTDSAGVKATKKAIKALKETEVELRVVVIPDGKDPDELIKLNPKKWRDAVKASIPAHEFLIRVAIKQNNPATPDGKRAIMNELLPVLLEIEHAVELEYYIKILATELKVKVSSVEEDVKAYKTRGKVVVKKKEKKVVVIKKDFSLREIQERYVIFLLSNLNASEVKQKALVLKDLVFVVPAINFIVKELLSLNTQFNLKSFNLSLPSDIQEQFSDIYMDRKLRKDIEKVEIADEFAKAVKKLKNMIVADEIKKIEAELSVLDDVLEKTEAQIERQNVLLKKIVELNRVKIKV